MSNPESYQVTNLVSNNPANRPQLLDPYISLGWGIAIRPAGLGGHFWINNSGTGTVTEYVGDVSGVPIFQDSLKVVEVTPTAANPFGISGPTGQVFNGSGDFVITQDHPNGEITAPSKFIFVSSDGGISAWTERKNPDGSFDSPLESEVVVDKLGDSIYYGAAITNFAAKNRLYAVDFGATPGIEVYDANFNEISENFAFINPFLSEGYAPYNIQNINDSLFVAYAIPSPKIPGDEVIGAGLGRIAEFDLEGNLISTWNDAGLLNAPWGFVAAPDDFGAYSNSLLVSNFGDGTIVAFDPRTRMAIDYLRDDGNIPIAIDGLWGLTFGNGNSLGETNDLYFAAGNDIGNNPGDGVFGKVEVTTDLDLPTSGGDQSIAGTAMDDLFVLSGDRNSFSLGGGSDIVTARGLDQIVNAGDGNDIISIGSGSVDLGEGNNFVAASAGSAQVTAGAGDDTVNLVQGSLIARVGNGNNHVTSGAGDDVIIAGSGDDIVHAGAGNNWIDLGQGNNTINSIINQGLLLLSVGQNMITTGDGSDLFRLGAGEGVSTITNFDESDRFELVGFKPDFSGALSFSDLTIVQQNDDTVISLTDPMTGTEDLLAILQNFQANRIDASTFGEALPNPPVVSFTATPTQLNEAEGTEVLFQFTVTGEFPEAGIIIRIDENFFGSDQIDFSVYEETGLEFFDFTEPSPGRFISDYRLTQPQASIRSVVFDDNIAEGDGTYTTSLLPIPEANYDLDPDATSVTIFVTDGVAGAGGPAVSLTVDRTQLTEGDSLTITLNANGTLPSSGLEVAVDSDAFGALADFVTGFVREAGDPSVRFTGLAGFPIPNADASGFQAIMTQETATITLNVTEDGELEGLESFIFRVLDGENYDVDPEANEIHLTLADLPLQSGSGSLFGSRQNERLQGSDGDDSLYGNGGADMLIGGAGNDLIYGGSESDSILAGAGDDLIYGNGGGDQIDAGSGLDTIWLGAGAAVITLNSGEGYVTVNNFQLGATQFAISGGADSLSYRSSDSGVRISQGEDLLAIVSWQTTDVFNDNTAAIFV